MAELSQFVTVSITAATSQPSQTGFGVPLLLGYTDVFPELVRTYTGANAMLTDGFTVNDPLYKMAAAVFSQNPRPPYIKVGRAAGWGVNEHWTSVDITAMGSGDTVSFTVTLTDGTTADITQDWDTSTAITEAALLAKIAAVDAALNVQSGVFAAGILSVEHTTVGEQVYYSSLDGPVEIQDVTADLGYDTDLANILNVDSDFYGIAIDVNSSANMTDVAAWALANKRIAVFGPQFQDPSLHTLANTWRLADQDRVASIIHKESRAEAPGAAFLGRWLPFRPGEATMAYKSLAGVTADPWTDSELVTIATDNSMAYTTVAQLPVILDGKAHGGEFLDIRRGLDWLEARIQERVFGLLANAKKVPMTNAGIQMVVNEVEAQLAQAVDVGLLDEGSTLVTFKDISEIPAADRTARILSGIEFTGRLAGAVHKVTMFGNFDV